MTFTTHQNCHTDTVKFVTVLNNVCSFNLTHKARFCLDPTFMSKRYEDEFQLTILQLGPSLYCKEILDEFIIML